MSEDILLLLLKPYQTKLHDKVCLSSKRYTDADVIVFLSSPSQHRLCDLCHEIFVKESLRSNYTLLEDPNEEHQAKTGPDLNFEVRSERLATPADTPTTDS